MFLKGEVILRNVLELNLQLFTTNPVSRFLTQNKHHGDVTFYSSTFLSPELLLPETSFRPSEKNKKTNTLPAAV